MSSSSADVNEKYATSDAEMNAEEISNNKIAIRHKITSKLKKWNSKPLKIDKKKKMGTSSNYINLS